MPIAVVCSCGARVTVADTAAGKGRRCPKCGAAVEVPRPGATAADPAELAMSEVAKVSASAEETIEDAIMSRRAGSEPAMIVLPRSRSGPWRLVLEIALA